MNIIVRDFQPQDALRLDIAAQVAFSEYEKYFDNWPKYFNEWGLMSALSDKGRIAVATVDGEVVGGSCYVPPHHVIPWIDDQSAVVRSLVVLPNFRGQGIGTALMKACIDYAVQDKNALLSFNTTEFMKGAARICEKHGFRKVQELEPVDRVTWLIYCKRLTEDPARR